MIQKVHRKTSGAAVRPTVAPSAVDFRVGDLVKAERDYPATFSIPVQPEAKTDAAPRESEPIGIAVPEMPSIAQPAAPPPAASDAVPPPPPLAEPEPGPGTSTGEQSAFAPRTEEAPTQYQEASTVLEEALSLSSEDSLAEWVGEALASFQPDSSARVVSHADRNKAPKSSRETDPSILPKSTAQKAPPVSPEPPAPDPIASMWQPAPPADMESVASAMWTPEAEEPAPAVPEARSRDEIADAVLANSLTDLPRVVLLGIGKTFITGWRGRGPGLAPGRITGIRVPVAGRSVFASVRDSGAPHFGPVDPEEWTPALKAVLGKTPPECAVFPIRVGDDVAAFLYADRLGEAMPYEDFAKVARAAASAAGVLARFLLRANAPVG
jgi:hypothetical protein